MSDATQTEDQGLLVTCQCRYISFRTPTTRPLRIACCHCTSCRKQAASAFGSSAFYPTDSFISNLPQEVKDRLQLFTVTADSGNKKHCYFCPECGVRLYAHSHKPDGTPVGIVSIKAGCVEGLEWKDVIHIWTKSAVVPIPEGVKQYEKGPPPL